MTPDQIDFSDLRLVRKYGSWWKVQQAFMLFTAGSHNRDVLEKYPTPESAWAAFLKQEDQDGEA